MLCFALYVLLRFQHIPWCSGRVCYQRFLEVRTPAPFLDIPAASPNRYAALAVEEEEEDEDIFAPKSDKKALKKAERTARKARTLWGLNGVQSDR